MRTLDAEHIVLPNSPSWYFDGKYVRVVQPGSGRDVVLSLKYGFLWNALQDAPSVKQLSETVRKSEFHVEPAELCDILNHLMGLHLVKIVHPCWIEAEATVR